ncbi:LysR family transcriptional regulator [Paenibacillus aurantiacus]|uniref:LysR family transcriptional regulator n=1 Tax=Paenibacillus aurantiacus TaxID=1936118 RepID=A0ABV5KVM2_9BACL
MIYINRMISTEWYRIFLATAKLGNLTKAAQELHITQPSVSYAIKQLEGTLAVKLFDRLPKGVSLTTEGRELLDYVEKSFAMLEAGENKLRSLKELASGELRIGASGPMIKHLILPALDRMRADYPGIRIRLSQGSTPDIRQRLKGGKLDIGFVHLPLTDPELNVTQLQTVQDCFVVGSAYRELAARPMTALELTRVPLLLYSPGSSTRRFVDQWLASHGLSAEVDIELNSLDMLIELAERGYGAAFLTRAYVEAQLEAGRLFELQVKEPIPPRSVGIAVRADQSLPVAAERFLAMLRGRGAITRETSPAEDRQHGQLP